VPEEYILEHEQIHFALAESAARRLDEKAQEIVKSLRPRGKSQAEVEKVLVGTVEDMMKAAIEDLLERNRRFDQDTSNTYAPEKQRRWYDEVMGELK
jgi:DNA-directed RNA polymerase specialized sigma subunit